MAKEAGVDQEVVLHLVSMVRPVLVRVVEAQMGTGTS